LAGGAALGCSSDEEDEEERGDPLALPLPPAASGGDPIEEDP